MSDPATWSMKPADYVMDTDDGDVFTIMVGGSTLDLDPGDGLVLLNENGDQADSGTVEELKEGFSGPKGVAPTFSTVTVRRWDSFKVQDDKKGDI